MSKYKKITIFSIVITAVILTAGTLLFNKKVAAIFGHRGSYFALTGAVKSINPTDGNLTVNIKKAAGALTISKDLPKDFTFNVASACEREFPPEPPDPNSNCVPVLIENTPLNLSEISNNDPIRIRGAVAVDPDNAENFQVSIIKIKLGYEVLTAEGVLRTIELSNPNETLFSIENAEGQIVSFKALRGIIISQKNILSNFSELQETIDSGTAEEFLTTISYFKKGSGNNAVNYATKIVIE